FQAEDGIRDRNVTGVQTCALPILQLARSAGVTMPGHEQGGYGPPTQQPWTTAYPQQPGYQQPPPGHQQPPGYQQPPPGYQQPPEIGRASCRERGKHREATRGENRQ